MNTASALRGRAAAFGPAWGHAAIIRDPVFWMLAGLGFMGLVLPEPGFSLAWHALLVKAFVEEFFLRFLLQDSLLSFAVLRDRLGPVSTANILASLLFAGLHLFSHSLLGSLLVFFPSLIFGYVWERYGRLWVPVVLHFFYNACLFYQGAVL
jgi:hypothetical protein